MGATSPAVLAVPWWRYRAPHIIRLSSCTCTVRRGATTRASWVVSGGTCAYRTLPLSFPPAVFHACSLTFLLPLQALHLPLKKQRRAPTPNTHHSCLPLPCPSSSARLRRNLTTTTHTTSIFAHLLYLQGQPALLLVLLIPAHHVHGFYSLSASPSHSLHSKEALKHTHPSAYL